jgi:carbonic anhydrase/acetyltransferase-like protein (isoleucine patch superfamily)
MIYELGELSPRLAPDVFIAPDARVIGDVTIGAGSGVWFGCVVRGDVHFIEIGENTNVQDLSMLHVTGGKFPLRIGNNCTLGHRVTVHGCNLRDHAFVGIGATVMDDCEIGEFGLLAAGALLTPGKKIPPRMVAMGSPAKVVREITPEEEQMILNIPVKYRELRDRYRGQNGFREVSQAAPP